ncbi:ABC transporter permease subunit [[Clostridium] hylemonae]|uniref:ABC transporter permease n=1 Tax=[Clostridium] hylemonae TaxID=89153 RepID=UPI001D079F9E|nr:ABC transporter permease subunit [[Clostridium] hylemonae]MCB7520128.1 ABC transporter permease subunit [[Clostridium] hylemonae]
MGTKHIKKILAAAGLIVFWQIAALIARSGGEYSAVLVPTWGKVLTESLPGFAAFRGGALPNYADALYVLVSNSLITVKRVVTGLFIGGAAGVVTGIIIGLQPVLRGMFYPVVKILRNIPLLALIALFLVWFGGEEIGIIVYIAFGLWIIYTTNIIEAIDNTDRIRINFARTLGAKNMDVYTNVIIPMIVPNIINATKVALGVAWAIALGGEFLAAQDGLGRLLIVSQQYMETGRMLIILIVFIALTAIFGWIVKVTGNRITRWMP